MHISKSLLTFTLYMASINLAMAAPVEIENPASNGLDTRGGHAPGSSKSHPIEGTMEVKPDNALPFDADCYAILCLGKEPLFQRDGLESNENRKDAGVKKKFGNTSTGPFRNTAEANVKIPGAQYVSPEEFPFASTTQGGHQAILFPVSEESQSSQGGTINGFYKKNNIHSAHKGPNSWYKITGWSGPLGPYCQALQANHGKPDPHNPICKKGHKAAGKWGFDVGEYAYTYDGHSYHKAKGSK
ncbi:hypothetical protein MW887_001084 [Aspergillus wentii]|nr:hypothetical protein MW887_001084 [Aspergillus wentii]